MTPQTFGRFTILRKLPAGGMGRVYEATDPAAGRRVALKLIDRGTDRDSIEVVSAERQGAILQKQLCSLDPRITAVYEYDNDPEYFYIVMEYIDGLDLSELTAQQRIGYPFAARIAQDVLEVLDKTHNFRTTIEGRNFHGVIHGDIKPRNIRLTNVGQVKVLDFGIAKALSLTHRYTQNVFGSVQYSSPERLNTGEVTVSSDLWSVAVVLYELVAGHPYFQGDSSPRLEHMVRNYRAIGPIPEECPDELKQILRRALSPDPAARYQMAEEFAADLKAYRSGEPVAVPVDIEATRRTVRATGNGDAETRRTVATADPPAPSAEVPTTDMEATRRTAEGSFTAAPRSPAVVGAVPRPPLLPPRRRGYGRAGRIALLTFLAFGAIVGAFFVHEYLVWRDAHDLANDLESERLQKLDVAWQRYEDVANRSHFGIELWAAQDALRNRLLADANRVIGEYRSSDSPSVSENDWERARLSAARALELMPHDKTVRGTLRVIDGHLNRIRGSGRRPDAKLLQTSRENFEEATRLMPKSPDPWLGLARLYVYSLHDVDRAESALREAEKRGHDIGKRETAQLADGYRDRAERMLRAAQGADGQPEQERLLDLAKKDFNRARGLYESIIPFAGSSAALRRTYDGLDRIEFVKQETSRAAAEHTEVH